MLSTVFCTVCEVCESVCVVIRPHQKQSRSHIEIILHREIYKASTCACMRFLAKIHSASLYSIQGGVLNRRQNVAGCCHRVLGAEAVWTIKIQLVSLPELVNILGERPAADYERHLRPYMILKSGY
jgi:hypothetical protein